MAATGRTTMRPEFLETRDGGRIACRHRDGAAPGVLFCPGFHSDMQGEKALALDVWCAEGGRQCTRFDYFGHGESSGAFEKGRIGRWRDDTLAVLDAVATGPQILVGSSMGGWMGLLAAVARPERVAGLVGIAAAPDFTRTMVAESFDEAMRRQLDDQGYCDLPSHYEEDSCYRVERDFFEEAESHCLLDGPIPIEAPVRLLHGQMDADVPWRRSLEVAAALRGEDVEVRLIKDGDHRLSRPRDIARLIATVESLLS